MDLDISLQLLMSNKQYNIAGLKGILRRENGLWECVT